jgi:LacI family transcriptional regulator
MPNRRSARLRLELPARRPTINDVARLAKVSKKTVSRVINDSPFVHVETRRKIKAVITELGFAPDPQARGLASRRSFLIGMIFDDPLGQNAIDLLQGVLDALRGTGFELVIRAGDPGETAFLPEMRAFIEGQRLFAVLLAPALVKDARLIELLRILGVPFASIEGRPLRDAALATTAKLIG